MLSSARRRANGFVVVPKLREGGGGGGTYVRMILTMLHECDYPDTIACNIYLIIFTFLELSPAFPVTSQFTYSPGGRRLLTRNYYLSVSGSLS